MHDCVRGSQKTASTNIFPRVASTNIFSKIFSFIFQKYMKNIFQMMALTNIFPRTASTNIFQRYYQGGRTWQPFVRSKNGNENFRQARIYNFCDKCVVFARNRKFAKLTQWNMQYIPWNTALLAQETLFLTQKGTSFAQISQKKCEMRDKS